MLHNVFWHQEGVANPVPAFPPASLHVSFWYVPAKRSKMQNAAKASRRIDDIYIVMQFADLNIPLPCLDSPGQVLISLFGGHPAI